MSRIAALYTPWLGIVLENIDRFLPISSSGKDEIHQNTSNKASVSIRNSTCLSRQDENSSVATINSTSTPVRLSHR